MMRMRPERRADLRLVKGDRLMKNAHIQAIALALVLVCAMALAQKPIALIGKDLTTWKTRGEHNGWKIESGLLVNAPPSSDIFTNEKFWNFELKYEYAVPKGSNSGMYLRGRYEIQILDDFGKDPSPGGNGSIYSLSVAKANASKPAGEWNHVEVRLVDFRVTVKINGKVVQDNAELTKATGGALDDKVNEPGPIMIQGDHGAVSLRNIQLKKLPGGPPKT
jgi:hypothetical protein